MNQEEIDWGKKFTKIFKKKSVNCRHYETNITSEPFGLKLAQIPTFFYTFFGSTELFMQTVTRSEERIFHRDPNCKNRVWGKILQKNIFCLVTTRDTY